MDSSRLLILIFLVITTSESSERQCFHFDKESYNLLEGEAFYFVHAAVDVNLNDEKFTWSRKNSQPEEISTDENEMIHYHGSKLFFLNLSMEDSGIYTARNESKECYSYPLKIEVFKASNATSNKLLYGGVKNSDQNKRILCPNPVSYMCATLNGDFTWKKDSKLLEGQHGNDLWVFNATKDKEGIYTCICTWKHNQKVYTSSGSRRLETKEQVVHFTPEILSPTNKEEFADEGAGIKLVCSVHCGYNVKRDCNPSWYINGIPLTKMDAGYNMTKSVTNDAGLTISSAVLTIEKVSAKDFQSQFKCVCVGFEKTVTKTLTLKPRESIIPLVMGGVCVLFFCVFFAALVKCFTVDLALFFRPYIPQSSRNKDVRVYDAYVVYQMQSMDKVTEDTLCQFVTRTLPSVLEEKCGYRLFIHGRDDIPGEDRLELVEDRMKQSRRLMIILSPGPESGSEITDKWPASHQISMIGGFDWQVGLHHALVQREISVILIQLGDTGPQGYTHLPLGLQHLIRKSAPIRWPEGSRGATAWNSRFWKRVRYLMPATPAKKYLQSAIV